MQKARKKQQPGHRDFVVDHKLVGFRLHNSLLSETREPSCKQFACSSPALALTTLKEPLLYCTVPVFDSSLCWISLALAPGHWGNRQQPLASLCSLCRHPSGHTVEKVGSACDCLASLELARNLQVFLQEGSCKCGAAHCYLCMPKLTGRQFAQWHCSTCSVYMLCFLPCTLCLY